jgi:hypothetical protein
MRFFGIRMSNDVSLPEPSIPQARLVRAIPPPPPAAGNILDEAVAEAFNMACHLGDLDEAAELLALRVKWHARRSYSDENARRTDKISLRRMHGELERRHIMRGRPPQATE